MVNKSGNELFRYPSTRLCDAPAKSSDIPEKSDNWIREFIILALFRSTWLPCA